MKKLSIIFLVVIFLATNIEVANSTFSICAVDPVTGQVGSAGASCIANCLILSYIQPNWGVAHIQAQWTQTNYNNAKRMMLLHYSPAMIRDSVVLQDGNPTIRQYGIVDLVGGGRVAAYTGTGCTNYKGHKMGPNYSIQGNILLGSQILDSMEARFLRQTGTLADKLMAALQGAKVVGADTRCAGSGRSTISSFIRVRKPADTTGSQYLELIVPSTQPNHDPIDSLQILYNQWLLTNVNSIQEEIPVSPELFQNFPNPFNPVTKIKFSVPTASFVSLKVYNALGKNISNLLNENMNPGVYFSPSSGADLNSGVYFYTLETKDLNTGKIYKEAKKMFLVK
jgi:uncharacterized Ntn-hydrolase superfamily protein